MATVTRKRTLVNGYRRTNRARRKLSPKQIRFFGTPAQKAALRRSRAAKRNAAKPNHSHRAKSRRPVRPNVSAIVTAGLPAAFGNPHGRKKGHVTTMAKATKRRRTNASRKSNGQFQARRHKTTTRRRRRTNPFRANRSHRSHRPRTRVREVIKYRTRTRTNRYAKRRRNGYRRNPSVKGSSSLLINSAIAAANAIGSRWVPQFFLGANNTGVMGYGANIATGLVGAWVAKKFMGKSAGYAALLGLGISILLRAANDFTPWGTALSLNGFGDAGMGALVPSDFVQPPVYDGNWNLQIPASWKAAAIPPATPQGAPTSARKGMGSMYSKSFYSAR